MKCPSRPAMRRARCRPMVMRSLGSSVATQTANSDRLAPDRFGVWCHDSSHPWVRRHQSPALAWAMTANFPRKRHCRENYRWLDHCRNFLDFGLTPPTSSWRRPCPIRIAILRGPQSQGDRDNPPEASRAKKKQCLRRTHSAAVPVRQSCRRFLHGAIARALSVSNLGVA